MPTVSPPTHPLPAERPAVVGFTPVNPATSGRSRRGSVAICAWKWLMSHKCYDRGMTEVAARELRNNVRGLLDRVDGGETITITASGRPVADLVPHLRTARWMPRSRFIEFVLGDQADAGLTADLADLAGDTTDDLPWP